MQTWVHNSCPFSGKDHTSEMKSQQMKAHKFRHDLPFFTFSTLDNPLSKDGSYYYLEETKAYFYCAVLVKKFLAIFGTRRFSSVSYELRH